MSYIINVYTSVGTYLILFNSVKFNFNFFKLIIAFKIYYAY